MSDTANPTEMAATVAQNGPSADDLFDVLAVSRRRTVLSILRERQTPIDGETLAQRIASHERDSPQEPVSDSAVQQIHVSLHHVHLPKLETAELVTYDREEGVVEVTDDADGIPIDVE